ncbi:MAG: hypothetical protein Q9N68_07110, partial [Gammaproteobacteria bacterium]|nr:hypothetical protein [Gammaproteobacteria bacterium]
MANKEGVSYPKVKLGKGRNKIEYEALIGYVTQQTPNPFSQSLKKGEDPFLQSRAGCVFEGLQSIKESCCAILEKEGFSCTEIMKDNPKI